MPTVQSQPPPQPLESSLDHQCQSTRRCKQYRYSRNPIAYSPQYQAYRARQSRDGNQEDAKWPEILEFAFLDALVDIPAMGRRKFSYKGKPHGRNELIKEYIWIAYLQSLAPGQRPDPSMARDRKQVSSHIQVLKGFLKDHPAFGRLFPSNKSPKNGFEDSFKNDPCLRALSQGRLPDRRYEQYDDLNAVSSKYEQGFMKPAIFWLLITSAKFQEDHRDLSEMDTVTHRYSRLSSQTRQINLDMISNWRQKFPYLEPVSAAGEMNCDIIHLDVSLDLMEIHIQDGADLVTRSEMSIPSQGNERCEWQTVTSLIKPPELYQDYTADPPWEAKVTSTTILSVNETETRLKVRFPAEEWAEILTRLTDIQLKYEQSQRYQPFEQEGFINVTRPVRELVHQISMHQEVQSSSGPGMPFIRRAIILWTFRAAMPGEAAQTTWRYVDPTPSRSCMSPSPHSSHQRSAVMNDNFNTWGDSPSHLQHQNVLDPYIRGLLSPPSSAGLQSSFPAHDYGYHDQQFDAPPDKFSFEHTATVAGESALVESNIRENMNSCLSNTTNAGIGFDHDPHHWNLPHSESLNPGPAWVSYAMVPSVTAQIDRDSGGVNITWPIDTNPRLAPWSEYRDMKGDWAEMDPAKQNQVYIEQNDDKLLPWSGMADGEAKNIHIQADDAQHPTLVTGVTDTKDPSWISSDTYYDFNRLVGGLRS